MSYNRLDRDDGDLDNDEPEMAPYPHSQHSRPLPTQLPHTSPPPVTPYHSSLENDLVYPGNTLHRTYSHETSSDGMGYQMEERRHDNVYAYSPSPGPYLAPPLHDQLQPQPTYSVDGIANSFGHNEQFEETHPYRSNSPIRIPAGDDPRPYQQPIYPDRPEYALDPAAIRDTHYAPPYEPVPSASTLVNEGPYQQYRDDVPILQHPAEYDVGEYPVEDQPSPSDDVISTDAAGAAAGGRSPTPAIRRWKTIKEVQLFQGNLVLDCPAAPRLLNQINHAQPPERDEYTHMRYSAATCDPAHFAEERFTLRQRLFALQRHTELFIVVTMYNEDDFLFARTMAGVFKNIEYICKKVKDPMWGKDAWKKIVVCVVSDGRAKINPRTRAVLAGLGVYQDGIAKQQVNGKDVTAHIYEYTTQMNIEVSRHGLVEIRPRQDVPVQMIFCLKEKNQKKINSHRWFFQAFGELLQPHVCVLLDAGTKPGGKSIYELWRAFNLQPNCGGACGEIKVMTAKGKNLLNPLVAGQNFEYKMSNILDKPLESAFGFISVLPGAFSAYRWQALQNDPSGRGPLEKYFAGEKMHGANAGIFTANMYLAEDRILCFELVTKRHQNWILQYVKSATGETDVPDRMAEFILQRRRWLNGSFFAAVYSIVHFYQITRSSHSFLRKTMLIIEFIYQTINILFAWFAIGNFFLVFRILTTSLSNKTLLGTAGRILGVVFEWLYLFTLVACFILAMGNRPGGSNKFYMTMVYFWICLMIYLSFAAVFVTVKSIQHQVQKKDFTFADVFKNSEFFSMIVSLASTYVMWIVASILFLDPWHLVTSFIQYILLTPTYINVLNIYAFCNTHDITWGTKGDDKPEKLGSANIKPDGKLDIELPQDDGDLNAQYDAELAKFAAKAPKEKSERSEADKQEDYYRGFRSAVVLVWIVCNFALGAVVLNTAGFDRIEMKSEDTLTQNSTIYMAVILWSVAGLSFFRFCGAMWYLVVRAFRGV